MAVTLLKIWGLSSHRRVEKSIPEYCLPREIEDGSLDTNGLNRMIGAGINESKGLVSSSIDKSSCQVASNAKPIF